MVLTAVLVGCDDANEPAAGTMFKVEVVGQRFNVRVEGDAAIAAMNARLQSGQEGVVHGKLLRGNGGFNSPWGWHLDPTTVTTPDAAFELCDGSPSYVQEELDYYLDSVKFYCPWGAKVVSRAQ